MGETKKSDEIREYNRVYATDSMWDVAKKRAEESAGDGVRH